VGDPVDMCALPAHFIVFCICVHSQQA